MSQETGMQELNKAIAEIRQYKAGKGMALNAEIEKAVISSPESLEGVVEEIKGTGKAKEVRLSKGEFKVEVS